MISNHGYRLPWWRGTCESPQQIIEAYENKIRRLPSVEYVISFSERVSLNGEALRDDKLVDGSQK